MRVTHDRIGASTWIVPNADRSRKKKNLFNKEQEAIDFAAAESMQWLLGQLEEEAQNLTKNSQNAKAVKARIAALLKELEA